MVLRHWVAVSVVVDNLTDGIGPTHTQTGVLAFLVDAGRCLVTVGADKAFPFEAINKGVTNESNRALASRAVVDNLTVGSGRTQTQTGVLALHVS